MFQLYLALMLTVNQTSTDVAPKFYGAAPLQVEALKGINNIYFSDIAGPIRHDRLGHPMWENDDYHAMNSWLAAKIRDSGAKVRVDFPRLFPPLPKELETFEVPDDGQAQPFVSLTYELKPDIRGFLYDVQLTVLDKAIVKRNGREVPLSEIYYCRVSDVPADTKKTVEWGKKLIDNFVRDLASQNKEGTEVYKAVR